MSRDNPFGGGPLGGMFGDFLGEDFARSHESGADALKNAADGKARRPEDMSEPEFLRKMPFRCWSEKQRLDFLSGWEHEKIGTEFPPECSATEAFKIGQREAKR